MQSFPVNWIKIRVFPSLITINF